MKIYYQYIVISLLFVPTVAFSANNDSSQGQQPPIVLTNKGSAVFEIPPKAQEAVPEGITISKDGVFNSKTGKRVKPKGTGESKADGVMIGTGGAGFQASSQWCSTLYGRTWFTYYGFYGDYHGSSRTTECNNGPAFNVDYLQVDIWNDGSARKSKVGTNTSYVETNFSVYCCVTWGFPFTYPGAPTHVNGYHLATHNGVSWSVSTRAEL